MTPSRALTRHSRVGRSSAQRVGSTRRARADESRRCRALSSTMACPPAASQASRIAASLASPCGGVCRLQSDVLAAGRCVVSPRTLAQFLSRTPHRPPRTRRMVWTVRNWSTSVNHTGSGVPSPSPSRTVDGRTARVRRESGADSTPAPGRGGAVPRRNESPPLMEPPDNPLTRSQRRGRPTIPA